MPSPFPGMDPFLEGQRWVGFHHRLISAMSEALVAHVRPRYVVEVEERVYVEYATEEPDEVIRPDVTVAEPTEPTPSTMRTGRGATLLTPAPVLLTLPQPLRHREAFLTLRERETMAVVSVIEVLSPTNKRAGSGGRLEYLNKRELVLDSPAHLVELDLLRGGVRLPMQEPLPTANYYAFVSRAQTRPTVEVYAWSLRQPLPSIPVPLAGSDPDVVLDLQVIFTTVYDRAGYDYSLDYRRPMELPLPDEDTAWVRQVVDAPSGRP